MKTRNIDTGLKSNLQNSEAKASLPIGTDTLVSENNNEIKVLPPKKNTHLPHIDLEGYYQFVTFRTFDSVDEFVKKLGLDNKSNKEKQLYIDEYLDVSTNGAYLQDDVLGYLCDLLIGYDKKLYELVAFCIMNNHVHILFKPLERLSKVMQMIKGVSAKKINELLGKNGKLWADDYYDKTIRNEKHFWVVYEYIKNNPQKISGTKVPPPTGTDTLVSENNNGIKVPLPRFYGIFE
ncbi:MAG: transposase [Sulfurimonas sp.]|nr:transposase [Sulfurimonas sp.]